MLMQNKYKKEKFLKKEKFKGTNFLFVKKPAF